MTTHNDTQNDLRQRPIGEVAKDLTRDVSTLVRQEIELARAEMAQKARVAASGVGMLGGAAVAGLCAAGALTACVILVFSLFLPEWLAALLVAAGLAAVAFALLRRGRQQVEKAGKPIPEQTVETVKEDVEWAKTRATSARK
jgi:Flp pilus assembly protein TadB